MAERPPPESVPPPPIAGPQAAAGDSWLVCPACDARVSFEACHTRCPRCHTLVESCSDGGRLG